MKAEHLSEMEIQQFALDKSNCRKDIIEHIESCEECMASAINYQLMFSAIHQQSKPAFDFDLRGLVLSRISQPEIKSSWSFLSVWLLVSLVVMSIGIAGYIFRKYLLQMFTGILPIMIYLMFLTAIAVIIFLGFDMYKKYQRQMSTLNSY